MSIDKAKKILADFFEIPANTFDKLPKDTAVSWARRTFDDKFKLTRDEHLFLIGRITSFTY
jgi:hypothetical protein